jgi:chorismate mutase
MRIPRRQRQTGPAAIASPSERAGQFMSVRGIRGATSVADDNPAVILAATTELLQELLRANQIDDFTEIVSAIFTTTADLTSTFPAEAARCLGMTQVPLLCAAEIAVPHSLPRCIRVLLHVNTHRSQAEVLHVYLHEAKKLRPDMVSAQ